MLPATAKLNGGFGWIVVRDPNPLEAKSAARGQAFCCTIPLNFRCPKSCKRNATRPDRKCIEQPMTALRLVQILVIAGAATTSAKATDVSRCFEQRVSAHGHCDESDTLSTPNHRLEVDSTSDDFGRQQPSGSDRRDRIFYPGDTERPKPLLRKLFLNIALDQKDIFTSPFHVNRHNALEWLVPMAVTGALIASDTHIANAFENSRGQVRWGGRISDIGASYTLIPLVAGSYVYGAWRDNPKGREIGVLGTESLLDSLIVAGVLKEVFRRNRPDEKHPGDFWGGGTSFPSGHAIQIWSIASLLDHEYKRKKIVGITAYTLAGIVSAARVAAQKHFASDVVAGGTMGWFIGRFVYNTHMSHLAHQHTSMMPMIVPQFAPLERRYAVTVYLGPTTGR